jgi:cobalt/nickel transport system permease protein
MQPIHLAIGIVEGMVTGAVLCFVYQARKEIIQNALSDNICTKVPVKRVFAGFIVATVLFGAVLSLYASSHPDGLEWSIGGIVDDAQLTNSSDTHVLAEELQEKTAILPYYAFLNQPENQLGTSVSGIVGAAITLTVTVLFGIIIMLLKKIKVKKNK